MSILGLDFGQKRIGFAESDELNLLAHPVGFVPFKTEPELISFVDNFVREHRIKKIVVGLPVTLKGETGFQAQKVLTFVEQLRQSMKCPIVTWDERLTTAQAEKLLLAQDISRSKRKVKRDAVAAEIMLQSYLDFLKQKDTSKNV